MSIFRFSVEALGNLAASAAAGPYVNPYSRDYAEGLERWSRILSEYSLANHAAFLARYSHHYSDEGAAAVVEARLSEIGYEPQEIREAAPAPSKIEHDEAASVAGLLTYNATNDSGWAVEFPDESDPAGFRTVERNGGTFINADVSAGLAELLSAIVLNALERKRRGQ